MVIPDRGKIRELRRAEGLTQARLAFLMPGNRHPQTICKIETGWGPEQISAYLLKDIADGLGVHMSEITLTGRTRFKPRRGLKAA